MGCGEPVVQPATVYLPERYGEEGVVVGVCAFCHLPNSSLWVLRSETAAKREKQGKGDVFYETHHHGAHAGYLGRASQGEEQTTVRGHCTLQ
jgi:hypothetical protein